jgi:alkylation response protein AidB-like acyl-CoA dehydrogenase
MILTETAEEAAFRQEVREFIRQNLSLQVARRFRRGWRWTRAETEPWTRKLHARGWSAPNWPTEHGGTGWSPMLRHIFETEMWAAGAPPTHNQNFDLVGPIVYTFGSDEQKRQILPAILSGDTYWAQGFSEPNAGSDLAALRTSAVRQGDHYLVNGQKIWTTDAEVCDGVFTLVRTSTEGKPQAGISFLLIDLRSPGVTVRPIKLMNGESHLNEVFFDNVKVPVTNRVGEENRGWDYSKILLVHERTASSRVPELRRDLASLRAHAAEVRTATGSPLIQDPFFRNEMGRLDIEVTALEYTVLRVLSEENQSSASQASSVLKIRGSELLQQVSELATKVLGSYANVVYPMPLDAEESWLASMPGPNWASGVSAAFLQFRAATIYGGSNEIQRNLLARALLK